MKVPIDTAPLHKQKIKHHQSRAFSHPTVSTELCNVFEVVCLVFTHSILHSLERFQAKKLPLKASLELHSALCEHESLHRHCVFTSTKFSLPSSNVKSKAKITIKFIAFTELVRKYAQGQSWRLSFQHSSLWRKPTTKKRESLICLEEVKWHEVITQDSVVNSRE